MNNESWNPESIDKSIECVHLINHRGFTKAKVYKAEDPRLSEQQENVDPHGLSSRTGSKLFE